MIPPFHLTSTEHRKSVQCTALLMLARLLFTVCRVHASDTIILDRNYTTLLFGKGALQLFYFAYQEKEEAKRSDASIAVKAPC